MVSLEKPSALPDADRHVYEMMVPQNHYLRQVAERIDFERFRPRLAEAYSQRLGRPAIDPVPMLKIFRRLRVAAIACHENNACTIEDRLKAGTPTKAGLCWSTQPGMPRDIDQ